jgi:hypothetical protein
VKAALRRTYKYLLYVDRRRKKELCHCCRHLSIVRLRISISCVYPSICSMRDWPIFVKLGMNIMSRVSSISWYFLLCVINDTLSNVCCVNLWKNYLHSLIRVEVRIMVFRRNLLNILLTCCFKENIRPASFRKILACTTRWPQDIFWCHDSKRRNIVKLFFWVLAPSRLVCGCQRFGETCCLHLQGCVRNACIYLRVYTPS